LGFIIDGDQEESNDCYGSQSACWLLNLDDIAQTNAIMNGDSVLNWRAIFERLTKTVSVGAKSREDDLESRGDARGDSKFSRSAHEILFLFLEIKDLDLEARNIVGCHGDYSLSL